MLLIILLLCHLFLSYRLNEITGWAQVPLSDQIEQILVHLRLIILLDEVQEIRNIAHQKKFALFTIEFTLMELNLQQDVVSIDVIGDSSPSLAL